ncbi:hypothetical protein AAFN60_19495 [Roseibacillus persicicus]|uniref:hypothetical protein n=1 Tax=Roseibacillus persicicus TaxID=454148 RepID=UPI00398B267F
MVLQEARCLAAANRAFDAVEAPSMGEERRDLVLRLEDDDDSVMLTVSLSE